MNRRAQLVQLLTAHSPADSTESAHRERMLALATSHGDPFARSRFDPGHFTVSAFVVSPDGASLLMIYHEKLERWLQPGGHVEPSDASLRSAARREVIEETGLPDEAFEDEIGAALDLDVHAIPQNEAEPGHLHHDLRFRFRFRSRSMPAVRPGGPDGVRWVALGEAATLNPEPAMERILMKLAAQPAFDGQEEP